MPEFCFRNCVKSGQIWVWDPCIEETIIFNTKKYFLFLSNELIASQNWPFCLEKEKKRKKLCSVYCFSREKKAFQFGHIIIPNTSAANSTKLPA